MGKVTTHFSGLFCEYMKIIEKRFIYAGSFALINIPGSVAFVPAVAGMILAGEVVEDLGGISNKK